MSEMVAIVNNRWIVLKGATRAWKRVYRSKGKNRGKRLKWVRR